MVSSGTVSSDSSQLDQYSSNYMSQLEGLSGTWKGPSHDGIMDKCGEFSAQMKQVSSQMQSFAEAVSLYEQYDQVNKDYHSYVDYYNSIRNSNDQSAINETKRKISECESKLQELAPKINAALSAASSFKLEATATNANVDATTGADTSTTDAAANQTDTNAAGVDAVTGAAVSTKGGEFVDKRSNGVYGYITSSTDGKTYTVFKQSEISGWARDCNRAAASSIASGFTSPNQAVSVAQQSANGLGYNSDVTNKYFNQFGLNANVRHIGGSYDTVKNDIINNLSNGNKVMFDLDRPNVHGQSGQKWSGSRHWLSVLDIKKTGNGPNDYAIFVSDSGHGGSTKDYGLGTGWYSINEFSGQKIANFTTVSKA